MSTKEKHLYYISELKDYKIKKNDPDIRGWVVKDLDNRIIGKVDNLLVNKELEKVVYVDVNVDQSIIDANHDPYAASATSEVREFINKEGENHIIIPIGLISLNRDEKYAFSESINYQTFAETKRYRSGTPISREYEHHVLGSYKRRHDDRDYRDDDLRRNYSDEERREHEHRRREEARLTDERRNREIPSEKYEKDRPLGDTEEKIRREKENLKYKSSYSSDRTEPVEGERHRDQRYREDTGEMYPERSIDDEQEWEHEDHRLKDQDHYESRRRKRRNSDDFYDRREFYDRDH